jgi:hypothetical protein
MNKLVSRGPASFVIFTDSAPLRAIKSLASGRKIAYYVKYWVRDWIGRGSGWEATFAPADAARLITLNELMAKKEEHYDISVDYEQYSQSR